MNQHFLLGDTKPSHYFFAVAASLGFIIGWVTADGAGVSLLTNLVIWQVQVLVPTALLIAVHSRLLSNASFEALGHWKQLIVSGVIGGVLFSPIGLAIDLFWIGEPIPGNLLYEFLDECIGITPPVTFVWLAMNAPWVLGYRLQKQATSPGISNQDRGATANDLVAPARSIGQGQGDSPAQRFYEQLPAELGRNIIMMEAELHYLRVVTTSGQALLLFNLRDASEAFPSFDGFLCHRSFWVARPHITAMKKSGRGAELTLSNGSKVPVSKRKLASFKAWYEAGKSLNS